LDYSPVYVSSVVKEGDPVRIILNEAEGWSPDCIFIGTRGISRLHHLLSGNLSAALVAQARCPVELVRTAKAMSTFTALLRLPATLLGL
jgi:nucleotide-binding universal stress UspA family protein